MEKFAKFNMKKWGLILFLFALCGCGSIQIPDYIRADHPYIRRIPGDYDRIVSSVKSVFASEGFAVQRKTDPSDFERRSEDQSKDILFFTEVKRYSRLIYSTYVHWNIFIHATADGAEVDIRYEALTPRSIKPSSTRNDKTANRLLDKIERSIESK